MSTSTRGAIAEQEFVLYALRRSWRVYAPTGAPHAVDKVVDRGNGLERVQIKRGFQRTKDKHLYLEVELRGSRGAQQHYHADDFDTLAVWNSGDGSWWLIPWSKCPRTTMSIPLEASRSSKYDKWKVER